MRQIEAFRAVMTSGGVTSAAAMLHISQPSVSRLIADLEYSVGFALFERRGGRMFPTGEARALFEAVRRSFVGLDLLEQAARRIRAHPMGTLRLAALPALAVTLLPGVLKRFSERHPDVKVTVEVLGQRAIEDRIFLGQADLGIGVAPAPREGVRSTTLARADYVCAIPAGHPFAERQEIGMADLAGVAFVGPMHEADDLWHGIDDAIAEAGIAMKRTWESQHSLTMYAMVEAGLGVAVVEPFSAALFTRLGVAVRPLRPAIAFEFALLEPDIGPSPELVTGIGRDLRETASACLDRLPR